MPFNGLFIIGWQRCCISESAGKYWFTTLACNKLILLKKWDTKLRFCFLKGINKQEGVIINNQSVNLITI
jgi:hypothetical protein